MYSRSLFQVARPSDWHGRLAVLRVVPLSPEAFATRADQPAPQPLGLEFRRWRHDGTPAQATAR